MATYKPTIPAAAGYDLTTGDSVFSLSKVENFNCFTIEILLDSVTYPAGEDDAEFDIVTREVDIAPWEPVTSTSAKQIVGGQANCVFRISGICTRNIAVQFTQNALNGGTITVINVTASE